MGTASSRSFSDMKFKSQCKPGGFLQEYNHKMNCTKKEVMLMPIKDGLDLRVRLVDRGCQSFINNNSGAVLQATKDQMISTQVWRNQWERIIINTLQESSEEVVGVYAKENCLIPAGMWKYILVQARSEITGEVLIKTRNKTILRLVLPNIVYIVKKTQKIVQEVLVQGT